MADGNNVSSTSENPNSDESERSIDAIAQQKVQVSKRHKFWETQPVGQFKDLGNPSLPEGPIEPPTPLSEVKQEPYNLPVPYEWITCDMDTEEMCSEVYNLLANNYVEDDENMFRFNYSKDFLQWALRPRVITQVGILGFESKLRKSL
ncbi:putative glycylpeptide N-tetradecanoyltransferase [Helianthus debilis subsp. tardiflorus]